MCTPRTLRRLHLFILF